MDTGAVVVKLGADRITGGGPQGMRSYTSTADFVPTRPRPEMELFCTLLLVTGFSVHERKEAVAVIMWMKWAMFSYLCP